MVIDPQINRKRKKDDQVSDDVEKNIPIEPKNKSRMTLFDIESKQHKTGRVSKTNSTIDNSFKTRFPGSSKISDRISDSSFSDETKFYQMYHYPPYIVYAQPLKETFINEKKKRVHPSELGSLIQEKFNEKNLVISKIGFNKFKISTPNLFTANSLLADKFFAEKNFKFFVPSSKLTKQGIVRDIPPPISLKNNS